MDRFEVFCETLYPAETGLLSELEKYAYENDVPIIRPGARRYLRWLLAAIRPEYILELGTAIGFSAILMADALPGARIITIENYEPRIPIARENIERAGLSDRINLLEGDAAQITEDMCHDLTTAGRTPRSPGAKMRGEGKIRDIPDGGFDLVFIDAAKAQYSVYLENVLPLCHRGSVIVFDNVLAQDSGSTLDSRYAIERRDRTIHARMRELLKSVTSDPRFVSDITETGDGMLSLVLK